MNYGHNEKIANVISFGRSKPLPYGNIYAIYISSKETIRGGGINKKTQNTPTVHTVGVFLVFVIRNINYIYFI